MWVGSVSTGVWVGVGACRVGAWGGWGVGFMVSVLAEFCEDGLTFCFSHAAFSLCHCSWSVLYLEWKYAFISDRVLNLRPAILMPPGGNVSSPFQHLENHFCCLVKCRSFSGIASPVSGSCTPTDSSDFIQWQNSW